MCGHLLLIYGYILLILFTGEDVELRTRGGQTKCYHFKTHTLGNPGGGRLCEDPGPIP